MRFFEDFNKVGPAVFGPLSDKENSIHTDRNFVRTTFLGAVDHNTDISVENA